jgi:hypothetical protein
MDSSEDPSESMADTFKDLEPRWMKGLKRSLGGVFGRIDFASQPQV